MPVFSQLRSDLNVLVKSIREKGLWETVRHIPRYLWLTKAQESADGFDKQFGTETSRIVSTAELNGIGPHQEDAVLYWPTRQVDFDQILKGLGGIDPHDFVFVDLGCGKGRVLLMASALPFKRVIGVDFSPALVETARHNVALSGGLERKSGDIEVIHADAAAFALPEEELIIFLFNPFGPRVLSQVLENVKASLKARPRRVFLLYNNCVHGALMGQAGLKLVAEGQGTLWPWQIYSNP